MKSLISTVVIAIFWSPTIAQNETKGIETKFTVNAKVSSTQNTPQNEFYLHSYWPNNCSSWSTLGSSTFSCGSTWLIHIQPGDTVFFSCYYLDEIYSNFPLDYQPFNIISGDSGVMYYENPSVIQDGTTKYTQQRYFTDTSKFFLNNHHFSPINVEILRYSPEKEPPSGSSSFISQQSNSNNVLITLGANIQANVYLHDMSGKVIGEWRIFEGQIIDMTNYPDACYFFSTSISGEQWFGKYLKF